MPAAQQEIAQKEITDMVDSGLLEPNPTSRYNSPYLILVKRLMEVHTYLLLICVEAQTRSVDHGALIQRV